MSKKHMGSSIDDFLKDEGIFDEAQAQAVKEVVAWQLPRRRQRRNLKTTHATARGCRILDMNRAIAAIILLLLTSSCASTEKHPSGPPERLPKNHVAAPVVRPSSNIVITLERSGCFGNCPHYTVTVSTEGIVFDGRQNVAFTGKHVDRVDADEVRSLAKKFVAADFYSMDSSYDVLMTDQPLYVLSIVIDGQTKKVQDYRGARAGMPAVVTEMEEEVDKLARTERWIKGRPMQK